MQDGIIAGNGNSRYLKTVAAALSLYPDYESFMAALIAGTFPIDLNGINAGGWTQQGTPLNKANLFSDSTASALGLTASNTPNDALAKIKALIDEANGNANSKAQTQIVYYVGTGVYGINNPTTITFSFPPRTIFWIGATYRGQLEYIFSKQVIPVEFATTEYTDGWGFSMPNKGKKSIDGKSFTWYSSNASDQANNEEWTYYYLGVS